MVFKPAPCKTRWEGLVVSLWIALIDLLLLVWVTQRQTDWLRFLLILIIALSTPLLLHLLYRTWGAFTLEYWVDRNAVTVRWANLRQIIPLPSIQQIVVGGLQDSPGQQWRQWPAPQVRRAYAPALARVMLFATKPLEECLLLDTGDAVFAISPRAEAEFLEAVQNRFQMGVTQPLAIEQVDTSTWERIVGPGRMGPILLGLGMAGALLLFGVLMLRFPDLPNPLPIRYTREGLPEMVRDKDLLFRLPTIGLFAWIVNGAWGVLMMVRRQPVGAYLLWGGTVVVQGFLFLALRSVLP